MMHIRRAPFVVLGLVALTAGSVLGGCQSSSPVASNAGLTSAVQTPKFPDLGRGAPRAEVEGVFNMYVAPPVRKVCTGSVPFFEFDSAQTRETDQPTMQTLSDCMLTGPLQGKRVTLIGHADPRGTDAYNDNLGLERAQKVKDYLVAHGVDPTRIDIASHGEAQASAAPADWPKDRRVEVQLAP